VFPAVTRSTLKRAVSQLACPLMLRIAGVRPFPRVAAMPHAQSPAYIPGGSCTKLTLPLCSRPIRGCGTLSFEALEAIASRMYG